MIIILTEVIFYKKDNDTKAINSFKTFFTELYSRWFQQTLFQFNFRFPLGKDHDFQQY